MRPDDAQQVETPAQWLEHSEAWRYAHLDLAPSEYFRRMAILEHDSLDGAPQNSQRSRHRWLRRPSTS